MMFPVNGIKTFTNDTEQLDQVLQKLPNYIIPVNQEQFNTKLKHFLWKNPNENVLTTQATANILYSDN